MREYREKWEGGEQLVPYKVFRRYVPVLISPIVDRIAQQELQEIEVLDIGGGDGSTSLRIIDSLQQAGIEILRWDVIDASESQLENFKANASGILKPEFNFYLTGWNDFLLKREYDFAFSRHSWYGVDKWRKEPRESNALFKLCKATKKGGVTLVVLVPRDNVLLAVPNKFQGDTTSDDVCEALRRIEIKFSCQIVKRPIPALLEGDELTEAGWGIFTYMLHTKDISPRKTEIESCLAKWFTEHKEWFTQSVFIWIEK